jgi:hypothetical protein
MTISATVGIVGILREGSEREGLISQPVGTTTIKEGSSLLGQIYLFVDTKR